jgi:hypothetical protein
MNKIYIVLFLLSFNSIQAQKQEITLENLIGCSMMSSEAFTSFIQHKGFKTGKDSAFSNPVTYLRTNKDKSKKQGIDRKENEEVVTLTFLTTDKSDYLYWTQELQSKFVVYKEKNTIGYNVIAFQKRNLKAKISQQSNNITPTYCLTLEYRKLPPPTDIHYAEDLLQLNSHEYIVALFGTTNVKKDVFYFSEKEANKCSILFPNTSNQVTFVWNDEENCQGISFLILGGAANESGNVAIFNGNQFHKWRSKQGIYLGMPLRELQSLNEKPIQFYGWETEQPGFVVSKSGGRINFKSLGIQLQCLECYKDGKNIPDQILTSETVLKANDRVLVNSLIILPN